MNSTEATLAIFASFRAAIVRKQFNAATIAGALAMCSDTGVSGALAGLPTHTVDPVMREFLIQVRDELRAILDMQMAEAKQMMDRDLGPRVVVAPAESGVAGKLTVLSGGRK